VSVEITFKYVKHSAVHFINVISKTTEVNMKIQIFRFTDMA